MMLYHEAISNEILKYCSTTSLASI